MDSGKQLYDETDHDREARIRQEIWSWWKNDNGPMIEYETVHDREARIRQKILSWWPGNTELVEK